MLYLFAVCQDRAINIKQIKKKKKEKAYIVCFYSDIFPVVV